MLEFFSRRKKRKLIVAGCSYVDDYAKSQKQVPYFSIVGLKLLVEKDCLGSQDL